MKNNDDIHSTDTNEIKHLINRVKQGELDQGDALLIEKLLSILLTIVSLLERKHTSIQRMKELLFGVPSAEWRRHSFFLGPTPFCRRDTIYRATASGQQGSLWIEAERRQLRPAAIYSHDTCHDNAPFSWVEILIHLLRLPSHAANSVIIRLFNRDESGNGPRS